MNDEAQGCAGCLLFAIVILVLCVPPFFIHDRLGGAGLERHFYREYLISMALIPLGN